MINLEQLKEFLKQKAKEDRHIQSVTVSGPTLDEALVSASIELGLAMRHIEYDIVQKGSRGLMGWGRRAWTIIAYRAEKKKTVLSQEQESSSVGFQTEDDQEQLDQDGGFFIRFWPDGIYLKVTPKKGQGNSVSEDQVMQDLVQKGVKTVNHQIVKDIVKLANSLYVPIGEYNHNPANDTMISIDVDSQEMHAFAFLSPPKQGGADLSYEEIEHFLKNSGVVYGILKKDIENLIDRPVYSQKIHVAAGAPAINGQDAKIVYLFETELKIKPHEIGSRIDFKELNMIRNVLQGEELAKKALAEQGVPGHTVTGRFLPAKNGKDVRFELGNNVALSEDGLKVVATADGQVLLIRGRITVETVIVITGDVDNSVGNINFLGSVIIRGSVFDGFVIKAMGNIEVMGNVGKAMLETHADIIVHQGINGDSGGKVIAGQSLWSKFIQNATVEVGDYVIVSDGILHSQVTAGKKILCKGRRAKIVGGRLRALQEINASSLGAVGSGDTLLEVGFDPKLKEVFEQQCAQKDALEKEIDQCTLNLQSVLKQEQSGQKLAPDKEEVRKKLTLELNELKTKMAALVKDLSKTQNELDSLRLVGKISSSGLVYPGIRVIIKDVSLHVIREYTGVTFVLDGSVIRVVKYEGIEEEEIIRKL